MSWINVGEIDEGAFGFLDPQVRILNLNDPIVERFAQIRSDLRRQGQILADFDIRLGAAELHQQAITENWRRLDQGLPAVRIEGL